MFLLDDKRISEINMVSGRTKKKTPKLHHLLSSVVTMSSSHNGELSMLTEAKAILSVDNPSLACCFSRNVALWTFIVWRTVSVEQG